MSDLELETLIKIARGFSPEKLATFLEVLPQEQKERVVAGLDQTSIEQSTVAGGATFNHTSSESPASKPPKSDPAHRTVFVEQQENTRQPAPGDDFVTSDTEIRLLRPHAKGAIGEIFVAFDSQLAREVALKRIRTKWANHKKQATRFVREAIITAKLQHPNIVPVYSIGNKDSVSHYTMPLVEGATLTEAISKAHLKLNENSSRENWIQNIRPLLIHFVAVCNAIDYAHSQGIIHRDLKPSNVIIGKHGQTLVLDWGCARRISDSETTYNQDESPTLSDSEVTLSGAVVGTLEYMSPEQAAGKLDELCPASDVFGLGATLFKLLTNETAIRRSRGEEVKPVVEKIKKGEFLRIADIDRRVPPALKAICEKAMRTDRRERYLSAGKMGNEISAFLAAEPIEAYPEPFIGRCKRQIRRHQTFFASLLGMVGVAAIAAVTLAVVTRRQQRKLEAANHQLEISISAEKKLAAESIAREEQIQRILYNNQMILASKASTEAGGIGRTQELIEEWRPGEFDSLRGWEWNYLDSICNLEKWSIDLPGTVDDVMFVRDQPLGDAFVTTHSAIFSVHPSSGEIKKRLRLDPGVTVGDVGPGREHLAIGFQDGRVLVLKPSDPDFAPVQLTELNSAITDMRWNIGGDYLAISDQSGNVKVWQWYERKLKASGTDALSHLGKRHLAWSYDGKEVSWATGTEIRNLEIATEQQTTITKDDWVDNPCWSHEGKLVAYVGPENTIVVVERKSGKTTRFTGHQLFIESLCWHPSQHFLASSSADGSVRVWNTDTEKEVRRLVGHSGPVYSAAWSHDGRMIVSGGLPEDKMRIWDMTDLGKEAFDRELQDRPAVSWHPHGQQLAVAERNDILIQDVSGNTRWIRLGDGDEIYGLSFNHAGNRIATVSGKGQVRVIDSESGQLVKEYDSGGDKITYPSITPKGVAWSPNDQFLSAVGANGKARVWNIATGEDVAANIETNEEISCVVAWAPTQPDQPLRIAFAGTGDKVRVFDPSSQKIVASLSLPGWKTALAWSQDAQRLAIGNRREVSVWDTQTTDQISNCEGSSAMILDLSWSDSQSRIAGLGEDGIINLWNAESSAHCASYDLHGPNPYCLAWSPDGRTLVSTERYGRIVFQNPKRAKTFDIRQPPQKPTRSE